MKISALMIPDPITITDAAWIQDAIEGLLYGGGLVIFGFIAGWIIKRPKQRSGLL
jgi:hypothetical protein